MGGQEGGWVSILLPLFHLVLLSFGLKPSRNVTILVISSVCCTLLWLKWAQLNPWQVKIGPLASATCHDQSGRGGLIFQKCSQKMGPRKKGFGERRCCHDNGARDAASPLPTRALFCSALASTILTPACHDEKNFYKVLT